MKTAADRRTQLEDVFDSQEDQARVYRQAATEMREAERLDAAYADLKARDVPDADRVRDAAALHRARAEELRTQAEAFDKPLPGTVGTTGSSSPDDGPIPAGVQLPPRTPEELRERGPFGANDPAPAEEGSAVAAQAEGEASADLPPEGTVADPLAGDPMADVASDPEPSFADASDVTGPGVDPGMDDGGGAGDPFDA